MAFPTIKTGRTFGGDIGTALGQGLSMMAQTKMAQMQHRQGQEETFRLLTMLGAPEHQAASLALAPKEVLNKILPSYIPSLAAAQSQSQQQQGTDLANLQGVSRAAPSQEAALGAPRADLTEGQDSAMQSPEGIEALQGDLSRAVNQPRMAPAIAPEQPVAPMASLPMAGPTKTLSKQQQMASILGGSNKLSQKDQMQAYKLTQKYRDTLADKADYAQEAINTLDTIMEADKRGDVIDPVLYGVLDKLGLPIEGLLSDDSILVKKSMGTFFKGLKPLFGARVTDNEVKYFLATIPTLMMSASGREVVARNMKNALSRDLIRSDIESKIIKQYGYPPPNLRELINDQTKPIFEKMDNDFKQEMTKLRASKAPKDTLFEKLPSASDFEPGAQIQGPDGKILTSDGKNWN